MSISAISLRSAKARTRLGIAGQKLRIRTHQPGLMDEGGLGRHRATGKRSVAGATIPRPAPCQIRPAAISGMRAGTARPRIGRG